MRNNVTGGAVLHGPTVQARDIQGGIHFHPPAERSGPRLPVPRQLPPVRTRLVDREADVRALDTLRAGRPSDAPQLMVVSGFAGVGKTTLVSRWLHEQTDSFPDGQLYADLAGHSTEEGSGPVQASTVLEGFLRALGAPSVPADTAQRVALWRSLTAGLRLAVLLDNAYTAAQVRPLLLGAPTGLTVVTSRTQLTGLLADGAAVHRLDALTTESAVELLTVGGGGQRVTHDLEAARRVVALCARLPLAICLASAQLAVRPHRSVSALAESLSQGYGPLDALRVDGEAVVRTALDLSYRLLPPESAALYRRAGLLPTDRYDLFMLTAVSAEPAARPDDGPDGTGQGYGTAADARDAGTGEAYAAYAADADAVDLALGTLVEANLLEETGPGTYRFHDLVRPHARRLGEEEESTARRDHTLRRYVDWCLATATSAESILTPSHRNLARDYTPPHVVPTAFDGPADALAWLDTRRDALMTAVRLCAEREWHASCWQLTDAMWPLVLRLRPTEIWCESHRLGLAAARASGSRAGEDRMLTSGAMGLRDAGRHAEAADWYTRALEHATADGDTKQRGQAINGLGHLSLLTGRLDEARAHFEHALRLWESVGYPRGVALCRRRLGETELEAADFPEATRQLAQAYRELKSMGEEYEAARVLATLGRALVLDGRPGDGTGKLTQALDAFRGSVARDAHWEARSLTWLGEAAEGQGHGDEARRHYEAARDILRLLTPDEARRMDDRLRHL
ncbi:tetratricopeptide repeat protein [Streptomyces sp. NBC_01725]|uniref:tetratricopeptide repeat protein n=1 Tax=Streptomyces sp. NBC_01725 TaxID=2975923 RepID=UPI002E2BD136|nr:tetratricopeptide repeat protein [Streptomyces sp. NBC_01725]